MNYSQPMSAELKRYRRATERAKQAIAQLGVFPDNPRSLQRVVNKVELLLWQFVRLRWHDIHQFFASVEPVEALELTKQRFEPGMVFDFFSERQDALEWENAMTVGICLVFASMRLLQERGFDPKTAGIFALQRMLEQVANDVGGLEELLERGAPL